MRASTRRIGFAVAVLGLVASPAHASLVIYSAFDNGAGPSDPRPQSNAAAASFDAAALALGTASVINFESAPIGSFHNLTVAPGVSINGTNSLGNDQTIRNTSNFPSFPALDGYNTTLGGTHFVELLAGNLVFTFTQPTQFFGAYITGAQTIFFIDTVTFSDGTNQTINVPASFVAGGVAFVGFTDAGKLISSVTVTASNPGSGGDFIGVDDVRYQSGPLTAVPEPTTLAGAATGVLMLASYAWRRRRRAVT